MPDTPLLSNRYQLEKRLGTGGMAVVYRATDQMLERTVAIKVLREDFSSDPGFRERFHQEAKAAANLSHPNIVTVHDFGLDAGRLFIVMEYIPGTDLKTILQQRGRFLVEEALPLVIQACAGIGYAHRAGLVHCDVKPHNLIVTPDQRLKVTDFGIARALASIHPDEQTDVVWGSPQYFAPEQASGGAPSPASDVYSLGVILFEMLTGRLPFTSTQPTELARLHRTAIPPSPQALNPTISPALNQIILKVLEKEPSARYRTADQLGRVLIGLNRPAPSVPASAPVIAQPQTQPPAQPIAQPPTPSVPLPSQPLPPLIRPRPQAVPMASPRPAPEEEPEEEYAEENPLDIDFATWGLALIATIAVLGLIPFWIWIYLMYNPPAP